MILDALTDREMQVFSYVRRGYSTEEIAMELSTSFENVKSHRSKILQKLAARNMAQAVNNFYQHYHYGEGGIT